MRCPSCDCALADFPQHGVEVRGIYDGTLFWVCSQCRHAWARFTNPRTHARLVGPSEEHAGLWNQALTAPRAGDETPTEQARVTSEVR